MPSHGRFGLPGAPPASPPDGPFFEVLEPRLLLSVVGGHIGVDTVWDDTSEPYLLGDDVIVDAGATLQIAGGVQVDQADTENWYAITIEGALEANGASLFRADIYTSSDGQLHLADCVLSDIYVSFDEDSHGLIDTCTGGTDEWWVSIDSDDVRVQGSSDFGAEIYASATFTGNDIDWLEIGSGAPTIQGNILEDQYALYLYEPGIDLSNVSGNTYVHPDPVIAFEGTVRGDTTLGAVDGLDRYLLDGWLQFDNDATLTVAAGTTLDLGAWSNVTASPGGNTIEVQGTFAASGQDLSGTTFVVRSGGTLNLTDCALDGASVTFEPGSAGLLDGCYGDEDAWTLDVRGDAVTVTGCTDIERAVVSGGTLTGNTIQDVQYDGGAPTVTGNTFYGDIRITDPDADLSGVSGNTYAGEQWSIGIEGVLDGPRTLLVVDGLSEYIITDDLTIAAGGSLQVGPGAYVSTTWGDSRLISVQGTFAADGMAFPSAVFRVRDGGTLNLTDCALDEATVFFEPGSSGTLDGCYGGEVRWGLSIESDGVTVTGCTGIDQATLDASCVLTGNTIWYAFFGAGAPTVTGNTFRRDLVITDPDVDTSGVSGNLFTGEQWYVGIEGLLDASRTLGPFDGITAYRLAGDLVVGPGAALDLAPGVSLGVDWGDEVALTIDGSFTATGLNLPGVSLAVNAGGTLNLTDCALDGADVTFAPGSAGTLDGCYGGEVRWSAHVAGDGVAVTNSSGIDHVTVAAAATVTGNTMQFIELAGGGPTVSGNYFADWYPTRITDPDVNLSGYGGNTYQYANRPIYIGGTLDGALALAPLDGRAQYRITPGLTVAEGASLTVPSGITLEVWDGVLVVDGTLTVEDGGVYGGGAQVTGSLFGRPGSTIWWGEIHVLDGGRMELDACLAWADFYYDEGSTGTVANCNDPEGYFWLYLSSDDVSVTASGDFWLEISASPTITGNAFSGLAIYGGTPTVENNVFDGAIWIEDPDADLSGFSGNTYTYADPTINIRGTLDGAATLGAVDGVGDYRLRGDLVVGAGANLAMAPGTSLAGLSGGLVVGGTFAATGVDLAQFNVTVRPGGQFSLTGCALSGVNVTYEAGAGGTLDACSAGTESSWNVEGAGPGVAITGCTGLGHVGLAGSATLTGSTLGYLVLDGGAPTVGNCTFTDEAAVRLLDPDTDLGGFTGPVFTAAEPLALFQGTVNGPVTLGPLAALHTYLLGGDLDVAAGASLGMAPGVTVLTDVHVSGRIDVAGTLALDGVTFESSDIRVVDGGTLNLSGCSFDGGSVVYENGSAGTVDACGATGAAWSLEVRADDVTVTGSSGATVVVSGSPTLQGNTLGGVSLENYGAPVITGNTFTSTVPLSLNDPDIGLAGVGANTYQPGSAVRLSGSPDGNLTLAPLPGLARYSLASSMTIQAGAVLTLAPGVHIETGDECRVNVSGTLDAVGATLDIDIRVREGASADFTSCVFLGGSVTYQGGDGEDAVGGTIEDCTGDWSLNVYGGNVTLIGPFAASYVEAGRPLALPDGSEVGSLYAASQVSAASSTFGQVDLGWGAEVTLTDCTLTDPLPLRLHDLAADTSGITGCTYTDPAPRVAINANLDGMLSLGEVAGLTAFQIEYLYLYPGAWLDIPTGTDIAFGDWASVSLSGRLSATDIDFGGAGYTYVYSGGTLDLVGCTFEGGEIWFYSGSGGTIEYSVLPNLFPHTGSTAVITHCDLASTNVTAQGDRYSTINLENNWWGTVNPTQIATRIYDHSDNSNYPYVDYQPFLASPPVYDVTGPMVLSSAALATQSGGVGRIEVTFSEQIDLAATDWAELWIAGPGGPIAFTGAELVDLTTYAFTFDEQPDANYTLHVGPGIADIAGNLLDQDEDGTMGETNGDDQYEAAFILDVNGPDAPADLAFADDTGSSADDGLTRDTSLAFTWSTLTDFSGIDHYEYRWDAGPWTATAVTTVQVAAAEGDHTFSARGVDGLGNLGLAADLQVTVDTTGPVVTGLAMDENTGASGNDLITADTSLVWSWTPATDPGGVWRHEVWYDGVGWLEAAGASFALTVTPGYHWFKVRAVDNAGNAGPETVVNYLVDVAAPAAPSGLTLADDLGGSGTDFVTSDPSPTFGWTAPADTSGIWTYEYRVDGGDWVQTATRAATVTPGDGVHQFDVRAIDNAGNVGAAVSAPFTLDLVPPAVTSQTPAGAVHAVVAYVDVEFGEAMDPGTLTDQDLALAGPDGPVPDAAFTVTDRGGNVFRIAFAPQRASGVYHLTVGPDVTDWAGNPMAAAYDATFEIALPDLVVTGVSGTPSGWPGTAVEVQWTIENIGPYAASGAWTDGIYASADDAWDLADILLATVPGEAIGAPGQYARSASVTLPMVDWVTHIVVRADSGQTLAEGDETNNAQAYAVSVSLTDLEALPFTAPTAATTDEQFGLVLAVLNSSTTWAEGAWHDGVYLSADAELGPGDRLLADVSSLGVSPLAGGGQYQRLVDVRIPWDVEPGTYYLLWVADAGEAVPESDNANNVRPSDPIAIGAPDLRVVSPSTPSQASGGDRVTVTWTVRNDGSGRTVAPGWTDKVYLSPTLSFNPQTAICLGGAAAPTVLGPSASYDQSLDVTIPGTPGTYYWFIQTDSYDNVHEVGHEDNNFNATAAPLTISAPPRPDLAPSGLATHGDLVSSNTVGIDWTVTNVGPVATTGAAWTDAVYLSPGATLVPGSSYLLGTTPSARHLLPNGDFYASTRDVTLPAGISGTWYLFVCADASGHVDEGGGEGNNRASLVLEIELEPTPDLGVAGVLAPDGPSGEPVAVTWTVVNHGTGTLAGAWTDAVFLSADAAYSPASDTFLAAFPVSGVLGPEGQYERTESVMLPDLIDGPYYVLVVTDSGRQIAEYQAGAEDNNVGGDALQVTFHAPDLVPAIDDAPSAATAGSLVAVSWTVTNAGAGRSRATAWTDYVYLSETETLDPGSATRLASYEHSGELLAGEGYSPTVEVQLPERAEGPYYLFVVTDGTGRVVEGAGEGNNTTAPAAIQIDVPPTADLTVAVEAGPGAFPGLPLEVTWTVVNAGPAATTPHEWYDEVYLSADDDLSTQADNVLLGRYRHTGDLGAAGSPDDRYTRSEQPAIPGGSLGPYHVFVVTDALDAVYEHPSETNNVAEASVTVAPPVSDLRATVVSAPSTAWSGQAITVSWTVANFGTQPTNLASWLDRVYLSEDETFGGDVEIGQAGRTGMLDPGGTYQQNVSVPLPAGLTGTYYVFVAANADGAVLETDTTNNTAYDPQPLVISLTPPPDLQVTDVQVPGEAWSGSSVSVRWDVLNASPGQASAGWWTDHVYLSPDAVFGGDTLLASIAHYGALAPGGTYSATTNVAMPANTSGTYYLFVETDAGNGVDEHGAEGNNTRYRAFQLNLTPPPDLQVTGVGAAGPAVAGLNLTVDWTVTNASDTAAAQSYWRDRLYLAPGPDLDPATAFLLANVVHAAGLPGHGDYHVSHTVTLPDGISGAYRLFVVSDVDNYVPEYAGEGNNTASAAVTVAPRPLPDLWAMNVLADTSAGAYAGHTIGASWTVFNGGPGATLATTWYDAVYLSLDTVLNTAGDVYLGSVRHDGAMAGGDAYTASATVTLPRTFVGDYYVFVIADTTGLVGEGAGEGNNAACDPTAVTITVAPQADLVISDVVAPIVGSPGGTASLAYTLTNEGAGTTGQSWSDAIYLSADAAWDVHDTLVTRIAHSASLGSGESRTIERTVALPAVVPGEYHLVVRTDTYNQVGEGDAGGETNNTLVADATVHVDLQHLTLGTPTAGVFTAEARSAYYAVTVASGQSLEILLDSTGDTGINELYVARGRVPTRYDYDVRAATRTADVQLLVPSDDRGGTYYVLAYARTVEGAQTPYEILADTTDLRLAMVSPAIQGNGADAIFIVEGVGFDAATSFALVTEGGTAYDAATVKVLSSQQLTATFAEGTLPAGWYAARVSGDAGETSERAHTVQILDGGNSLLTVNVAVPVLMGYHLPTTVTVEYANLGDVAMPAPLLVLTAEQNGERRPILTLNPALAGQWFAVADMPEGFDTSVHILADGRLPGILLPGERVSIEVYYGGWLVPWDFHYPPFQFMVSQTSQDQPIDWDAVRQEILPDGANPYVWSQFIERVGQTWGDYQQAIRETAQRLANLGYRTHDGRELFADLFDGVRSMGTAAVSGQVVDTGTGLPMANTGMALRSLADEGIIRQATTDGQGYFTFERVTNDRFEVLVAGCDSPDPLEVTVLGNRSVTGLRLEVSPLPEEEPVPPVAPVLAAGDPNMVLVEGLPHLVFTQNDQVYHAIHDGTGWGPARPIAGAEGRAPRLLYSPTLLEGTTPGLLLFWQSGQGNDTCIMYAVARPDGTGGWEWSKPAVQAAGDVGASGYGAVVDSAGNPVVVWQMADAENVDDDPDLYYSSGPLDTTALSWDHVEAVIALDEPVVLADGRVLPVGTQVALMDDGSAWVVSTQGAGGNPCGPCNPDWGFEVGYEFPSFKKGFTLPAGIPFIGGKNEVEIGGSLEVAGNLGGASAKGSLTGSAEFLQGHVTGSAEGSLELAWKLDANTCSYVFDEATLAGRIGVEGKVPIPQLTWHVWVGDAEVGLVVGGEISGELIFKGGPEGDYGRKPLGSLEGHLYLGIYAEASVLWGYAAKAEATGTGNIVITLDGDGLRLSDIYFAFAYKVVLACVVKISGTVRYPKTSPLAAESFGTLDEMIAALAGDTDETVTTELWDAPGTGNVYGTQSVLADVAGDFRDDSSALVTLGSDGLVYAFWVREPEDWSAGLGSSVWYATFDGAAWSAPLEVPGSAGFGRDLAVATDADGDLVLVWANADASGFSMSSDADDVLAAYEQSDVWFAEYAEGAWSAPAPLAPLPGEARYVSLGADAAGDLYLSWTEGDGDGQTLYASLWDGAAWSAAETVASGFFMSPATMAPMAGQPTLVWTQGVDDGEGGVPREGRLFSASLADGAWSAPVEIVFGLGTLALATDAAGAGPVLETQAGLSFSFTLGTSPPSGCCCALAGAPDAPEPYTDEWYAWLSRVVGSTDPNDKYGPAGYGEEAFVAAGSTLGYEVHFENIETASAPAQRVTISDVLDEDLDLYTFEFTELAFANHRIGVPAGLAYYRTTVDLRPDGIDCLAEIEAGLNLDTREVVVTFQAIDPATGAPPADPMVGLLYPNDETGRGQGHVSYRVAARAGVPPGTAIENQATIVFDRNAPLDTPLVANAVDAQAPTSAVAALPAQTDDASFQVSWSGADDGGSGVAGYDVYVSKDGAPFALWLQNTSDTTALFHGEPNAGYAFYSRARDHVGLMEAAPPVPDAFTTTPVVPTILGWYSVAMHEGVAGALEVADDGRFSEPRSTGISQLRIVFSEPISPLSLAPGSVAVSGTAADGQAVDLSAVTVSTSTLDGDTVGVVQFSSALPDQAWYVVTITGVTDIDGHALYGDNDRVITALVGDVDGDLIVGDADQAAVCDALGARVGGPEWSLRADVRTDGHISTRDRLEVFRSGGHTVAPPQSQDASATAAQGPSGPQAVAGRTNAEAAGDVADTAAQAFTTALATDGDDLPTWTADLAAGLQDTGDADWFRLVAPVSGTLAVDADWADPFAPGAPYVTLYEVYTGEAQPMLRLEDEGPGEASTVAVADRQYYVQVDRAAVPGDYELRIGLAEFDDYIILMNMDRVLADVPLRGEGYSVALIDTGVDYTHPDLAGRVILGPDLADRDNDPIDTVGHGTHVAGILAGSNPHCPGIASEANVVAVKVTSDGSTTTSMALIKQALEWVVANRSAYHIAAVNISLGGGCAAADTPVAGIEELYQSLVDAGVFISVAAGNSYAVYSGQDGLNLLAASNLVVAVGAVWDSNVGPVAWLNGARDYATAADRITAFTQRGAGLDLLAPGGDILNLGLGGGLTVRSGTSMAAPMAAGAALLLYEAGDDLGIQTTPAGTLDRLARTGALISDGDDEDDNVAHTGQWYSRIDVLAALSDLGLDMETEVLIPIT